MIVFDDAVPYTVTIPMNAFLAISDAASSLNVVIAGRNASHLSLFRDRHFKTRRTRT